jgi:4-hydroxy-3-methylbut-2-en-1-yl diphosphate reductase
MTLTVCVPLAVERLALRGALPGCRVLGTGMGPRRAAAAARAAGLGTAVSAANGAAAGNAVGTAGSAVLVAGVAGGLDPSVRPGDLVVATEIRAVDARAGGIRATGMGAGGIRAAGGAVTPVPSAPLLAGAIRRLGLPVHLGPVASTPTVVTGAARARLAATGALAVEMEAAALAAQIGAAALGAPEPASALPPERVGPPAADMEAAALAAAAGQVPFAMVRAVVDTTDHPLLRPGTPARALRALVNLRRAAPAIRQWAAAVGACAAGGEFTLPREVG